MLTIIVSISYTIEAFVMIWIISNFFNGWSMYESFSALELLFGYLLFIYSEVSCNTHTYTKIINRFFWVLQKITFLSYTPNEHISRTAYVCRSRKIVTVKRKLRT